MEEGRRRLSSFASTILPMDREQAVPFLALVEVVLGAQLLDQVNRLLRCGLHLLIYCSGSPGRAQSPASNQVQAHEVLAALPASGITLKDLLKGFSGRVQSEQDKKHFINLVKENSKYGPDKLLRPK